MAQKQELSEVLSAALSGGAEFAEIFLEDREETNIGSVNSVVRGVKSLRIYGAGLQLMAGGSRVYVYSNDTSKNSLLELVGRGTEMLSVCRKQEGSPEAEGDTIYGMRSPLILTERSLPNPNGVKIYPSEALVSDKIRALLLADKAARAAGPHVAALNVNYFDTDQRILVVNSEGLYTQDRRVTSRMRFQATVGLTGETFYNWEDYTRPQGFEAFREEEAYTDFAKDLIRRTEAMRTADTVTPRTVPVVLAAGGCGTLWHESCGHSLEATAIAAKRSAFVGKLGQKVAAPKVTLVDDGTMPGLYGSLAVDDEGHPARKNVLIKNGVLKGYLCDRYYGSLIGMESTGSGRRQNYTYAPVSRMTNTYLAPGEDDDEEMIRSVADGLFVKSIGGGTGGMQFSLEVKEGFWIRNGQLDRQVKGIMLTGNGSDVIKRIDRVGKKLGLEGGSFCGAASGLIPTTAMQPQVRISEMAIG